MRRTHTRTVKAQSHQLLASSPEQACSTWPMSVDPATIFTGPLGAWLSSEQHKLSLALTRTHLHTYIITRTLIAGGCSRVEIRQ